MGRRTWWGVAMVALAGSAIAETAVPFLNLGAGARAAGMGNAYTALANDATAMYWNPAGLVRLRRPSVVLQHSSLFDNEFTYEFAGYSRPLGKKAAWGLSFQYQSAGEIPAADAGGATVGTLEPSDLALALGGAYDLAGYSIGLSGKYIRSEVEKTATTFAGDVGFQTPGYLGDRLRLGVAATNMGGEIKYDETGEDLPQTVRGGLALRLTKNWVASAEASKVKDTDAAYGAGTEYRISLGDKWAVALRGGYNSEKSDLGDLSGLTFGLGLALGNLRVDYALVPSGDAGVTNVASLGYWF